MNLRRFFAVLFCLLANLFFLFADMNVDQDGNVNITESLTVEGDAEVGGTLVVETIEERSDTSIGQLHLFSGDDRNPEEFFRVDNPVSGAIYSSPSCSDRVPEGAKAVYIRWWVYKTATGTGNWYWAGFAQNDETNFDSNAATIATGTELTYAGTYHHDTIIVPIDSDYKFKVIWGGNGEYEFICNIIGYFM